MNLDVQWYAPWAAWAPRFVALLASQGVPFGYIIHGLGADTTDAAWLADAERNGRLWDGIVTTRPRIVYLQSWNPEPTHVLPETGQSMTSLILSDCARTHWLLACKGLH